MTREMVLDVGFREDQSRSTQGYCAENLAVIRHLAVNLIAQKRSAKGGNRDLRKLSDRFQDCQIN
jgi:predicted transposase YbfD/YdcC